MACVLFLDLGTATTVPWWVTLLFVLLWLGLFAVAVRWFVPRPTWVPWLPAAAVAIWFPVVLLGTTRLGWGS